MRKMADFSKIGKSNRSRGASYERKMAHMLTDGFGIKFKRSPRSGALLREGAFNGVFLGGDLSCEKDFRFSIECKNCKDTNIEAVLKNPETASLVKYWCQCIYDSKAASTKDRVKLPLLFFNMKSVRKDFACVCHNGWTYVGRSVSTGGPGDSLFVPVQQPFHMFIPLIEGPVKIEIDNKIVEMTNIPPMYIMLAEDFIKYANNVFYKE